MKFCRCCTITQFEIRLGNSKECGERFPVRSDPIERVSLCPSTLSARGQSGGQRQAQRGDAASLRAAEGDGEAAPGGAGQTGGQEMSNSTRLL